jgi:asparagine synthase (glutamine-hydrolysing)
MCGIYASINKRVQPEKTDRIKAGLASRGPDASCIVDLNDNTFIHSRLSFWDLTEKGNQPIFSNSRKHLLLFNGEIYNFKTLKKEFLGSMDLETATDTEVIIEGFEKFGLSFIDELVGIYAIVIYNTETNICTVLRDEHGTKPLYYSIKNNTLEICSVAKIVSNTLDFVNLGFYLQFGHYIDPLTAYEDVFSIEPGKIYQFQYGKLNVVREIKKKTSQSTQEKFDKLFDKVIASQSSCDVPIGSFISGGLDSSILSLKMGSKQNSFSIYFNESEFSEHEFQLLVAEKAGSVHIDQKIGVDYFTENIADFIHNTDNLSMDGFNTFSISKLVNANQIKSCLSGIGADEYFGGYTNYKKDKIFQTLTRMRKFNKYLGLPKGKYKRLDGRYSDFMAQLYTLNRGIFSDDEVSKILNKLNIDAGEYHNRKNALFNNLAIDKTKNHIFQLDQMVYLRGQLLRDADSYGMQNSVEIRVPFLDQRVTRYCENNKVVRQSELNKEFLVREYEKLLPKQIYNRQKMGFSFPFVNWMSSDKFQYSEDVKNKLHAGFSWQQLWTLFLLDEWIDTRTLKIL